MWLYLWLHIVERPISLARFLITKFAKMTPRRMLANILTLDEEKGKGGEIRLGKVKF